MRLKQIFENLEARAEYGASFTIFTASRADYFDPQDLAKLNAQLEEAMDLAGVDRFWPIETTETEYDYHQSPIANLRVTIKRSVQLINVIENLIGHGDYINGVEINLWKYTNNKPSGLLGSDPEVFEKFLQLGGRTEEDLAKISGSL
jgi:hypothetical protein